MTGPNQRNIPVQIQKASAGVNVSFSSTSVGEYTIDVQVKNQRLAGAPFRCVSCDNGSFICLLCVLLKGRGEVRNTEKLFRYRLRLKDFICISPENGYPLGVFSILSFYVYHIVQAQVHVVLMVNLFWSNSTSHG